MRDLRIAQLGTFDLDNLGDLLFPLVFNEWLRKLEPEFQLQVHCDLFGLKGVAGGVIYPDQAGCYPMTSFAGMDEAAHYDLVFIGGGDILRDDDTMLPQIYATESLHFSYPRLLSPSDMPERRLVLLAPGAPFPFTEPCQAFLRNSFRRLLRACVRDIHTADLVASLLPEGVEPELAPDIVNTIATVFPKSVLSTNPAHVLSGHCLQSGYICFQLRHSFMDEYAEIGCYLQRFQQETGLAVVLLEIGRCLGDDQILGRIAREFHFPYVSNDGSGTTSIMDKVAVIAHAKAFIGTSLHGNIIARAYDVPNFTFGNTQLKKIEGFFRGEKSAHVFPDLHDLFADIPALHQLICSERPDSVAQTTTPTDRIHEFLAAVVGDFISSEAPASSDFSAVLDQVFLSMNDERLRQKNFIGYIEPLAEALDDRCLVLEKLIDGYRDQVGELEQGLRENNALHQADLAQGQLQMASRELQVAGLEEALAGLQRELAAMQASKSWRLTGPLRDLRRKLH